MSQHYELNRDVIWDLGIAMQRWRRERGAKVEAVDAEIGQIGILFRRYLEEKYGMSLADSELRAASARVIQQPAQAAVGPVLPFGLLLATESEFAPSSVD